MYQTDLNISLDQLENYLHQLGEKAGAILSPDSVQSAISLAEGLSDGEEEDLLFEFDIEGNKVPLVVKASVRHMQGPRFSLMTPSQALFELVQANSEPAQANR
ncbi:hypothetical protein BTA51_13215 [Hahella sp. CCB-MM4]|uniref:hypothetical protein n=1 Tax=Hahella sp. (strain CCB-MM4) TaxID=1926491 RepID=UPI000B9A6BB5|nr:hypothetical protein [Hahella sp. CCB-MM4]OZG72914.1 hypothetical protein BTA51_13215 [Hahella sp. CCB-MM4]